MRLQLDERTLDLDRGLVGDEPLSPTETRLLRHLALRLDEPVAQEDLLHGVWGYHENVQSRTVTVTVNRLRNKLELDPAAPKHLITQRGFGYALHARPVRDPQLHPEAPLSPCLGRQEALQRALAALSEDHSLLVLGGPGIGKTRFAQEVASLWPGPVGWFDLEPAADRDAALDTLALGLGIHRGRDEIERLGEALADRTDVVILDGTERLAEALAADCAVWMRCGARLVVTSRVPLAIPGAVRLPLAPLSKQTSLAILERLGDLEPEERERIASRCEGHPLSLELEATAGGSDDASSGSTLERAFQRSWTLLDPSHRQALSRCAAFAGWFDADEASGLLGPQAPARTHLLQWHGLLHRRQRRLRLLASLQPAVIAADPGAVASARLDHLAFYGERAAVWSADYQTERRAAALEACVSARAELEAAFEHALERGTPPALASASEIVKALTYALRIRIGHWPRTMCARLAPHAPATDTGIWIRALHAEAREDLDGVHAALDEAERHGFVELAARQLGTLAMLAIHRADADATRAYCERGLSLDAGPRWTSRFWLGLAKAARCAGDADAVPQLLARAKETFGDAVDPPHACELFLSEGRAASDRGRMSEAREAFRQALAIAEQDGIGLTLSPVGGLARLDAQLGDLSSALCGHTEQAHLARRLGRAQQGRIAAIRIAEIQVDLGADDVDDLLERTRAAMPADLSPDLDIVLLAAELLRALERDDPERVRTAEQALDACPPASGNDAIHRAWRTIAAWTRKEPVPEGVYEHILALGEQELGWVVAGLAALDGDAETERALRRGLPAEGHGIARTLLHWAGHRRAGTAAADLPAGPRPSALLRVVRRRLQ